MHVLTATYVEFYAYLLLSIAVLSLGVSFALNDIFTEEYFFVIRLDRTLGFVSMAYYTMQARSVLC